MLFKHQSRAPVIDSAGSADLVDEGERVRVWQRERLEQLGYERHAAEMIVVAAWEHGEGCDLVHRMTDLLQRGATHTQAARIV